MFMFRFDCFFVYIHSDMVTRPAIIYLKLSDEIQSPFFNPDMASLFVCVKLPLKIRCYCQTKQYYTYFMTLIFWLFVFFFLHLVLKINRSIATKQTNVYANSNRTHHGHMIMQKWRKGKYCLKEMGREKRQIKLKTIHSKNISTLHTRA